MEGTSVRKKGLRKLVAARRELRRVMMKELFGIQNAEYKGKEKN